MQATRFQGAIRSAEQDSLDIFLVSAVVTVLAIRAYLQATNFPRIGGGGIHIAHVVWGGLGMAVAIGILLSFLSASTRRLAALIGGAGFGAFLDELGKFLTTDNNYFFRPTAALVYVVFVVLFLATRQVRSFRRLTPEENLVNAIEYSKDLALGRLSIAGRDHALALLAAADQANPLIPELRQEFLALPVARDETAPLMRLAALGQRRYEAILGSRWFRRAFVTVFLVQAAGTVLSATAALILAGAAFSGNVDARTALAAVRQEGFTAWVETAAALLGGWFTVLGAIHLRHSRLRAYRDFEFAVLVDLLLAQPFSLLNAGFAGAAQVLLDLALLGTLRYMHGQEHHLQSRAVARTANLAGAGGGSATPH